MLKLILARFTKEYSYYQALPENARRLLLSNYLYYLAYPLLTVFVNSYLWRENATASALVVFNVTTCLGIVAGFYANAPLLRRFHITHLYTFGLCLQALSILFIVASSSIYIPIWIYGLIAGLGGGFFWSNKNYLNLIHSRGPHRFYFNSLEFSGLTVLRVVMPLIAGTIFVLGSRFELYSQISAYHIVMGVAILGLFLSGYLLTHAQLPDVQTESATLGKVSPRWYWVRLFNFLNNSLDGFEYVLPIILIFTLLGEEGTLGLVTSLASLLSAGALYYFGRKSTISRVWRVTAGANLLFALIALSLSFFFTPLTALLFMAALSISKPLRFALPYTITMEIMDQEGKSGQYAYLTDNELAFNLGRISALSIVFYLASISQEVLLRFGPLLMVFPALLSLIPLKYMAKSLNRPS